MFYCNYNVWSVLRNKINLIDDQYGESNDLNQCVKDYKLLKKKNTNNNQKSTRFKKPHHLHFRIATKVNLTLTDAK